MVLSPWHSAHYVILVGPVQAFNWYVFVGMSGGNFGTGYGGGYGGGAMKGPGYGQRAAGPYGGVNGLCNFLSSESVL